METIEYIKESSNKNLKFLLKDFGFKTEMKNSAYDYYYVFKNKKVELQFLTSLGSVSLPDIKFTISGLNFNLNNLSKENNLERIIKKNHIRTHPIMEKEVKEYVREKKYNNTESKKDFIKNGMSEIDELIQEVAEILKNNEKILKGNIFPFIKSKFNWK